MFRSFNYAPALSKQGYYDVAGERQYNLNNITTYTVEVWEWISNFMLGLKLNHVSKRACFNTFKAEQNDRHFVDDICQIHLSEKRFLFCIVL